MGKIKDQALENEDIKSHKLTDQELNYLRLQNSCLGFHTLGQKLMSGFLYYVATNRLGYSIESNLQFEIDLNKPDDEAVLTIQLMPAEPPQTAQEPPTAPPVPAE